MKTDLAVELARALQASLLQGLPLADHPDPEIARFRSLMGDYPRRGGKLVRGTLTLLSTLAHGGTASLGMPAAVALELFQSWVLIHDDIEDDSELRRGIPALHRQVGMPVALNVGDALHVHMWRHLLQSGMPETVTGEFLDTITRTAEGQHLDLAWVEAGRLDVTEDEYLAMVRLKTAWYTVATPLRLGALLTGSEPASEFVDAGLDLGAAFQIRDDVLNLTSADPQVGGYGKEAAGDLIEAKRTLILAHFFASTSPEIRAEASERLLKPAARRTENDVQWLLARIRVSGSIDYAQTFAERLAAASLLRLRPVLHGLPGVAGRTGLLELLETLADRRK